MIYLVYNFLGKLKRYIEKYEDKQFWVYSNYRETGSLLIKNLSNERRIIFKPWDTEYVIGRKKTEGFINLHNEYKGQNIDNYIFIGRNFRDISKQFAIEGNSITLIELDFDNSKIRIIGSKNLDKTLLNILIEFADSIQFEIIYDSESMLRHIGLKNGVKEVNIVEKRLTNPTVFISYSWDNSKHKIWVLKLANDLIKNGVKVIIDEWDLRNYRNDLHIFMESGIRDSDHVIIICTSNYAKKANIREGGVGVENTIITGEFYDENKNGKYISIARDYDNNVKGCLPSYLKTKFAIDFKNDSKYDQNLEELLRIIHNKPKYIRPELGKIPNLKSISLE